LIEVKNLFVEELFHKLKNLLLIHSAKSFCFEIIILIETSDLHEEILSVTVHLIEIEASRKQHRNDFAFLGVERLLFTSSH